MWLSESAIEYDVSIGDAKSVSKSMQASMIVEMQQSPTRDSHNAPARGLPPPMMEPTAPPNGYARWTMMLMMLI